MGVSNGVEDGGGVDGDGFGGNSPSRQGAETASPEIGLRWWRCYGNFRGWMPIILGFSRRKEFIGGRAMSKGTQGAHTIRWRGEGVTRTTL
jgi:hypothetical protein